MAITVAPRQPAKFEIPGRVALTSGGGGLPKINITAGRSTAEIYLHGAHITGFQKNGEPPLLFMSGKSWFAPGKPIRGGVPICFPWFGPREGGPAHGLARILPWDLVETAAAQDGAVTIRLRLPVASLKPGWPALQTEFVVTVADTLAMELVATNKSAAALEIENCLHTYFAVSDITRVAITGLQAALFDDFAAGAGGARKVETGSVLRITKETNRVYPDSSSTVEVHDKKFHRTIRVAKFNSRSTVVWNPWTTQKMPDDFDPAEHKHMICVESGNLKQNKILLSPGKSTGLKVVLSSRPL
jgi:glucose-6-phosphate 1-epimerase